METPSIYEGMNENQMAAVYAEGNVMVIAGAGSGKTRTATVRQAHLIEQGNDPATLMGVTFTNKAANEMRERLTNLHPAGNDVRMTTFHSFGNRFMRQHAALVGRTENFTIYDNSNQIGLVRAIAKDPTFAKLEGSDNFNPKKFLTALSNIKDASTEIDIDVDLMLERNKISPAYAYLIREYEARLAQNNAMDFADLIRYAAAIMEMMPDTVPAISNLMVDEFQDTNHNQYRIVQSFHDAGANLFAVGDVDQTIYTWRGALPENMQSFINDFDATVIKLEENYRSTPSIIAGANSVIDNNSMRLEKTMRPMRTENAPIMEIHLEDMADEAAFVARQSKKIIEARPDAKVGILYRQNRYSRQTEIALRKQGIAYYMHKGIDFASRKEVSSALNILRLATNPKDMVALSFILDRFGSGVGERTIHSIATHYALTGESSLEPTAGTLTLSPKRMEAFSSCMSWVKQFADATPSSIPSLLVQPGTLDRLTKFQNEADQLTLDRVENIHELCRWISEFFIENPEADLAQFVQEASLDASSANSVEDTPVHLMTVHSSKGLEFTHVFIVGCTDQFFPGAYENIREFEEQRRLFYVAMTRAQNMLHLTIPHKTYMSESSPARFLTEIPHETKQVRQL